MPSEKPAIPAPSEGESNASPGCRDWAAGALGAASKKALAEDADLFPHQSVSTPCLSVITKAKGPWIEDAEGRRYLDFHGNNMHHIGYGHPRKDPAVDLAEDVLYRCLSGGLSFKISMGNTLTLTPPLVVTRDQMDQALDVLERAITDAAREAGLV